MNEPQDPQKRLLILDTSVIINFLILNRWPMLLQNRNYQMASPMLVIEQIRREERRQKLIESVHRHELDVVNEQIPSHVLSSIPGWIRHLGQQDTAVLVNAIALDASIAADDRRLAREAAGHNVSTILTTEMLLAEAVKQGHISLLLANGHLTQLRREKFHSRHPCLCHLCGVPCRCPTR